jgi:hypothetical protein
MRWTPQEIETYLNAREYIDTAVVPLMSISFGDEMKESAALTEFITLLSNHLERQFTGRLVLFPPFTYLKMEGNERALNELKNWETNIEKSEFKHIFYITSESNWKMHEEKFAGSFIWIPALPLENLTDSQKHSMIDSQVKQLLNLFIQKWHENS